MNEELYVILGDVIDSRKIKKRVEFQKKLIEGCKEINKSYEKDIYAKFKILKGIDEIGGVLSNITNCYKIITIMGERLYPNSIRFVLVSGHIEKGIKTKNIEIMDGSAFHKAADHMSKLKKEKFIFDMSVHNKLADTAIRHTVNLIYFLKKKWTTEQRKVIKIHEKTGNERLTGKELGVTQQAIHGFLRRSSWKKINTIEKELNDILHEYNLKLHGGN